MLLDESGIPFFAIFFLNVSTHGQHSRCHSRKNPPEQPRSPNAAGGPGGLPDAPGPTNLSAGGGRRNKRASLSFEDFGGGDDPGSLPLGLGTASVNSTKDSIGLSSGGRKGRASVSFDPCGDLEDGGLDGPNGTLQQLVIAKGTQNINFFTINGYL